MRWRVLAGVASLVAALADGPRARAEPPAGAGEPSRQTASTDLAPRESAEDRLARGRQAYARGDYQGALDLVRTLLYPDVKLSAADELVAHRLLALSYFLQQEIELAKQEFVALLQLKPDFQLDPVLDPPQAAKFLESIRRENEKRLEDLLAEQRRQEELLREQKRRDDEARNRVREVVVERTVERHNLAVAFVPFGVGQFQNGERKKGIAFLSTQLGLGAASLVLFGATYLKFPSGRYPASENGLRQGLQWSQVVTGGLFWVDVGWGIIDALVHFKSMVVTEKRTVSPGATTTSAIPRLAPYVSSGGGGLVLQGAF